MSLYASTIAVDSDITIGETTTGKEVATDLENKANYNYWSTEKDNTYVVYNPSSNNNNTSSNNNNNGLISNGIGPLILEDTSHIIFHGGTITNNTGPITLTGTRTFKNNAYILVNYNNTLTNKGTIILQDSSFIYIISNNLTNTGTGTIDISNITDLSKWINRGAFTLEGGSTFILPKSITKKINTSIWINPIILNGTDDNPVNIVIPKGCKYINDIDNNNKDALFSIIQEETGLIFNGDKNNVKFSWQTSIDNEYESVGEC
ncbi:MAG: hypothetical protein IJ481_01690 [Alphaproteobacteria bacterium]|nr:hypothetical protein [Alphaproteobacteria bacterium]